MSFHLALNLAVVLTSATSTERGLANVVTVTYRVNVAVSKLIRVMVEAMKLVDVTTMVVMLVEKTVIVPTCSVRWADVIVTVTVASAVVVGESAEVEAPVAEDGRDLR